MHKDIVELIGQFGEGETICLIEFDPLELRSAQCTAGQWHTPWPPGYQNHNGVLNNKGKGNNYLIDKISYRAMLEN